ncbi:MAG: DUF2867 domain-containing protein [Opitutaceae bacterium]|nr:DUF2867 domain-containing protein [Opitutaceae bacterium]
MRILFSLLAAVQLGAGGIHFFWLGEIEVGMITDGVPAPWRALTLLVVAATGVLLCALGVLALRAANGQRWREPASVALALAIAAAWAVRAGLEWRYPVEVALCGLVGWSPYVLGGAGLMVVLAGMAALGAGLSARRCAVQAHPLLAEHPLAVDYEDAFWVAVPTGTTVAAAMAEVCLTPWWMNAAMWLRDQLLARPLGLARAYDELRVRMGRGECFAVIAESAGARLMGETDAHLDFQLLVTVEPGAGVDRFVMITRVHFKNRAGRLYFVPVGPGHRWIVPRLLARAARRLWARVER